MSVQIYRFRIYDIAIDGYHLSRRWGTREAIDGIRNAVIIEETGTTVDDSAVNSDLFGLTVRDFDPSHVRP